MSDERNAKVNGKTVSEAELAEAMALLTKKRERDAKIESGELKGSYYKKVSEMTPAEQAVARARAKRQTAKQQILVQKAKASGITVTDAEVDAYIKANG